MEFLISADWGSLRPIQCLTQIPGQRYFACGSGVTAKTALARCRSEAIERQAFHELKNERGSEFQPVAMAAHPSRENCEAACISEAIERLALEAVERNSVHATKILSIGGVSLFQLKIFGAGQRRHLFTLITGTHRGHPIATSAVSSSRILSTIKAWDEFRKLKRLDPNTPEQVAAYTSANKILSTESHRSLRKQRAFSSSATRKLDLASQIKSLQSRVIFRDDHFVAFLERKGVRS